ncbi:MAG: adenosylmethionine--8-amino-7-oxononanoate transaminase [Limisphaerales bacterium]
MSPALLDRKYIWHPFTQMRDWLKREPIVIVEGKGAVLRDAKGNEYLDGNSSIWTNLHGHRHPKINAAIRRQLGKIAHSSALGLANVPASFLAEKLIRAANSSPAQNAARKLRWVFFSDDGSTAIEAALKMAHQFACRTRPGKEPKFLAVGGAYHGDTIGAVSLGHIDLFHRAYGGLLFKSDSVPSPYCYRCPFNRAKPERADAREYRRCHWECVGLVERKFSARKKKGNAYAAFIVEPLMQGAAGMIAQPKGWLHRASAIARGHGALLIADEVMTGFGRSGSLFACHQESVRPDLMALAKGMTGGYLPMAATLTTQCIFDAFLGRYDEFKTFYHGHSYTANQLGAAASLASLELLQSPRSTAARRILEKTLRVELESLWSLPAVGDIRQAGLMAGVELVKNWKTRERFAARERVGIRVCEAMARRGVLTRPVGDVIVLMPPYCTTPAQARRTVAALREAVAEVC